VISGQILPAGEQVARLVCFDALLVFLNIGGHVLSYPPAPCLLVVAYLTTESVDSVNERNRKMSEPRVSLDDAATLLRCTTRSLFKIVEIVLPELKKSLDPTVRLPRNCRSRAAAAMLVLKEVRDSVEQVSFAMQCLESAIKRDADSGAEQLDTSLKIAPR
jgi:hypothetical protein